MIKRYTFVSMEYTAQQFAWSTADIEASLFEGDSSEAQEVQNQGAALTPGTYRVIDGQLVRVVGGSPLHL